MPARSVAFACLFAGLALFAAAVTRAQPARPSVHKDGFSAKDVSFQKGDANVQYAEKDHKISAEHHKSATTSEYIKVEANPPPGATTAEFVHYYYNCPASPVVERMTARLHVKAYRAGVQVKARVVLPRERDPRAPDSPLTILITGETYTKVRQWQALGFDDPQAALKKQLPLLRARLGREVDPADAFIDRLVLNVYAGPGVTEVWVDDLEIGPVRADATLPGRPKVGADAGNKANSKPRLVEFNAGQILVDGDPFFFTGIRHSDTPLKTLKDAGFNTIFFPYDAPPETVEDAIRHGFWTVPDLNLPAGGWDGAAPKKPDPAQVEKDADAVAKQLRKYMSGDAVLMWNFGSGRTAEDLPRVTRAAEVVRQYDPRRPRSVDLWDGFRAYGQYVNAEGAHRWPLFSSLELRFYHLWLEQRRALIPPGRLMWTWVQTHTPDWLAEQLTGKRDPQAFPEPVGPHPEQIRTLAYLSIAAGCRGLGFWSDKFLAADTHHGKARLYELALLNAEIEMLKETLAGAQDAAQLVVTSDPNVLCAIVAGKGEILLLPVWMGAGTQYTPPQGAVNAITVVVPLVPEGATPWRVTPAGVEQMKGFTRGAAGTTLTIPDFDLSAAIVFTTDLGIKGKVVKWQDDTRFRMGRTAAEWAQAAAVDQYETTAAVHAKILAAGGPTVEVPEAPELFARCREHLSCAKEYFENKQWDQAYRESRKATRPLRVLMRADWDKAVGSLDIPTASPFGVSFFTLPQHYALAAEVRNSRPAGNGLAHGGFELSRPAPAAGAAVDSLPGWKVRTTILDDVTPVAAIVNADTVGVKDPPIPPVVPSMLRSSPQRVAPQVRTVPQPECGQHVLRLELRQNPRLDSAGTPAQPIAALERAVLAVDSPPAEFAPGGLVRVSFWVKTIPTVAGPGIAATADGLVVFDSAGGEPLGVRVLYQPTWKQYRLYRRVPASGKVGLTFAMTGLGVAFVDDVRIEPLIPGAPDGAAGPSNFGPRPDPSTPLAPPREQQLRGPAAPTPVRPAGYEKPVTPGAGRP